MRTFFNMTMSDFLIFIICLGPVKSSLFGMYTAVSMDTGCWFGPLELRSPSKFRTRWGRGWVVWILGGDADERSDCSRCDGQFKSFLKFPPRNFSGFFWRHRSHRSFPLRLAPSKGAFLFLGRFQL